MGISCDCLQSSMCICPSIYVQGPYLRFLECRITSNGLHLIAENCCNLQWLSMLICKPNFQNDIELNVFLRSIKCASTLIGLVIQADMQWTQFSCQGWYSTEPNTSYLSFSHQCAISESRTEEDKFETSYSVDLRCPKLKVFIFSGRNVLPLMPIYDDEEIATDKKRPIWPRNKINFAIVKHLLKSLSFHSPLLECIGMLDGMYNFTSPDHQYFQQYQTYCHSLFPNLKIVCADDTETDSRHLGRYEIGKRFSHLTSDVGDFYGFAATPIVVPSISYTYRGLLLQCVIEKKVFYELKLD